jgi:hypothetical protein
MHTWFWDVAGLLKWLVSEAFIDSTRDCERIVANWEGNPKIEFLPECRSSGLDDTTGPLSLCSAGFSVRLVVGFGMPAVPIE